MRAIFLDKELYLKNPLIGFPIQRNKTEPYHGLNLVNKVYLVHLICDNQGG